MENNSQESNQNTNYQPQNQGQAYPQPHNAPPQNQEPKDPQLQCQKSLLYQQAEDLEQINKQEQLSAYSQQPLQPMQQSLEQIQPLQPMQPPQQQMEQSLEQIQPLQPMQPPQQQMEQSLEQMQPLQPPQQQMEQSQKPPQQIQQPYTPYQPIYASQNANAGVLPEEPISFSDWMITFLLLCIPVINVIVLFLWAFGKHSKKSKENYAKAALVWVFIWTLIGFTIFTVFWGIINGTL